MAATGQYLYDVEFSWYAPKTSGLPTNSTLEERKMSYWLSQIGGAQTANETINEVEKRWLRSLTGVVSNEDTGVMWREAVAGAGVVPTDSVEENKKLYYRNV